MSDTAIRPDRQEALTRHHLVSHLHRVHISLLTFFGLIQRFLKLIEFLFQLPDSKATCAKEIIVHEFKDLSTHMELLECFRSEIFQVVSEPFSSFELTIMMAVEFSIALSGIMAVDNSLNKVSQFAELAIGSWYRALLCLRCRS